MIEHINILRNLVFGILVAALFMPVAVTTGESATCLEDWSIAGPIVRDRNLISPKHIRKRAEKEFAGELIKLGLCNKGERHFYRLVIFDASGKLRTIMLDAAKPAE